MQYVPFTQNAGEAHTQATRKELVVLKTQLRKEKGQNDVRAKALKVLATISQLKPYMLAEEVIAMRAIMEPYTLPLYKVASLTPDALSNLVVAGDLVDEEVEEQEQQDQEPDAANEMEDSPTPDMIRTPSEMRRDVSAALQAQGFRIADINDVANRTPWSNGQTFDEKLKLMLTMLRPSPTAPATTRTAKVAVVNDTPSEKFTVKIAMVDESQLTLPQTIEQRVRQVPA